MSREKREEEQTAALHFLHTHKQWQGAAAAVATCLHLLWFSDAQTNRVNLVIRLPGQSLPPTDLHEVGEGQIQGE